MKKDSITTLKLSILDEAITNIDQCKLYGALTTAELSMSKLERCKSNEVITKVDLSLLHEAIYNIKLSYMKL